MEEKDYTDLDKIFREAMGDNDPDGFDLPDDQILEAALLQLDQKPKRRAFIILFIGVLLLTALWMLTRQKEVKTDTQSFLVSNAEKTNKYEKLTLKKLETEKPVIETINEKAEQAFSETIEVHERLVNNQHGQLINKNVVLREKKIIDASVAGEGETNYHNSKANHVSVTIPRINTIEQNELIAPYRILEEPEFYYDQPNKKSSLSVSLFGEALYTSFTMSNNNGQLVNELVDYDKSYLGFRGGLGLAQNFSERFVLNYQLSYSSIKNQSSYQSNMLYQSSNEYLTTEGELMYSDQVNAQTPIGVLSRNVSFNVADAGVSQNDLMLAKSRTIQRYKMLSFGLSASYHIASFGPIQISPSLGLRTSYLLGLDHLTDVEMYYNDQMFFQNEMSGKEKQSVNSLLFSGDLGLKLSLSMSEKLVTSFKVGYEKNFNSLRKANPLDATKTNYNSYYLGLSTSYSF